MTTEECQLDLKLTTDTPYLALTGELWGVYCEDLGKNWPRYSGTALYRVHIWCIQYHKVIDILIYKDRKSIW